MKIIPKIDKALIMFMENKDLPPHGKAFAWSITIVFLALGLAGAYRLAFGG